MIRPVFLALSAAAFLAGCSAISALGDVSTPLDAYDLSAPANGPVARGSALARDLVVEIPTAPGALDTDRILVRPHPLQAQYLPGARWAESAPVMMQTLMLRSLTDSSAFRYVGRRPLGGAGDYALLTEITDFQAEAGAGSKVATIRLRLTARLVREGDATIVAQRSFAASGVTAGTETLQIVEGFNIAAQGLLTDLTGWVLTTLNVPVKAGS